MKTLKILTIASLAIVALVATAQTDRRAEVRVVIDGSVMQFPDQQPMQSSGRVLVPLRGVFERLGASVDWNSDDQTVTAHKRGTRVMLVIGRHHATVNGNDVRLDVPARLVGGSTMVPLRFVSEALGAEVSWNEAMLEVDITGADNAAIQSSRNVRQ